MIKIDGKEYSVSVTEVSLETEFLYKYATRTESFDLSYELGGVFLNQEIKLGVENSENDDFVAVYKLLSSKSTIDNGTGHNVQIWTPMGKMTFLMYPNSVQVQLYKERNEKTWWNEMTVKFIAVKPVESW